MNYTNVNIRTNIFFVTSIIVYYLLLIKNLVVVLTIIILLLSIILTVGIFFYAVIPLAFAEEVITILPGAQDHNRSRFLDITFYPIESGMELTWFNDDKVSHRIIIDETTDKSNNTELVADSGIIKP